MRQRASVVVALLLAVLAGSGAAQERLPLSPEAFDVASVEEKRKVLNGIIVQRVRLPSADTVALIKSGLRDADGDVRVTALNAVASRASGPRWTASPNVSEAMRDRILETWLGDKPVLEELRPMVRAALDDPEPRVRRNAVLALGSMDFDVRDPELTLSERTVAALAARYAREPTAHVRDVIMQSFALGKEDFPIVRHAILAALDDPDPHVRQYALRGAERLQLQAAVPKVVKALRDPDAHIRFLAANALGSCCVTPACLTALEEAFEKETDHRITRPEIERAIERVRGRH